MTTVPDGFKDLLTGKRAFANLATINADGTPQVTPVWFDWDGWNVLINSAKGLVNDKNLRRTPTVAMSIQDPDNPYRYVQIKGRVTSVTETGADAHIDALAKKYLGQDRYPYRKADEVRVTYVIAPDRVQTTGSEPPTRDRARRRLQGLRRAGAPPRSVVAHRPRRADRSLWPQRRRQDHALSHSGRCGGAGRRSGAPRQRRQRRLSAAGSRGERGRHRPRRGALRLRRGLASRGGARTSCCPHGRSGGDRGHHRALRRGAASLRGAGRLSPGGGGQDHPGRPRLRHGGRASSARGVLGRLADARGARAPSPPPARSSPSRRADEPSRSGVSRLARELPEFVRGQRGGGVARSLLPEPHGHLHRRDGAGRHHPV